MNNNIREIEPIFGQRFFQMKFFDDTDEIERRFGKDGGFLIDYACGVISFKQYMMRCDIQGVDDYNIRLLQSVADFYQEFVEKVQKDIKYYKPDTVCKFNSFKHRLLLFKYEISQLNLKMINNL